VSNLTLISVVGSVAFLMAIGIAVLVMSKN